MRTTTPGQNFADHVRRRLGVDAAAALVARPLEGGVSSDIWLVTGAATDVVVKRALPRLRVREEWRSAPERVLTEAAALRLAGRIRPGRVPGVVDVDTESLTIIMERAPSDWQPWKSRLLAGDVRSRLAGRLGDDLAAWHAATAGAPVLADSGAFDELRVSPFYRVAATRNPAVAAEIERLVASMAGRRLCLVHGDFSPKNVLTGESGDWVLDWEVAHHGDPTFDVAFLLTHLLLKAVHLPGSAAGLRECGDEFLAAYRAGVPPPLALVPELLVGHVGCLLLARVDGKSPAEYLGLAERLQVREIALATLGGDIRSIDGLWRAAGADTATEDTRT